MASAGRGGGSAEFGGGHSVPPQFVKVLNHVSTHLGLFEIPEKFARRHRQLFGDMVVLRVPTGDSWNLLLEKDGGKIWFGSAWKNFVNHYSLGPGNSLFFEYEGNSTFRVVIFDLAESEIGYPVETETPNRGFASVKIEETSDDGSVEMIGAFTPGSARSHGLQFSTESDDESSSMSATQSATSDSEYVPSVVDLHASANRRSAGPSRQRAGRVRVPPRRSAPRAANLEAYFAFFEMTISRSYLYKPLVIPSTFLLRHNLTRHMSVRIEHLGKPWPMALRYDPEKPQGCLSPGWVKFVKETNLEEGD